MTKRPSLLAAVMVVLSDLAIGCSAGSLPEPRFALKSDQACPDPSSADYFVPAGALFAPEFWDLRRKELMANFLREAGETPLWCGGGDATVYRLLWVPSFGAAVLARAEESDGRWQGTGVTFIDSRTAPGHRTESPWQVFTKSTNDIPEAAVVRLDEAVNSNQFWTMPAWRHSPETSDGDIWFIEGRNAGAYRIVTRDRFSDPAFEQLGREILEAAGLNVPPGMEAQR